MTSYLVLGGARSGKTRRALQLASRVGRKAYIATAEAFDDEMRERIAQHQAERDANWQTVEAPLELAEAIAKPPDAARVAVVDCLTLWLSNLMHAERDIGAETTKLTQAVAKCPIDVILVSNEVGLGIVPENALARRFRDAQGRLNQEVAAHVDIVEFVAAGLPMRLKPAGSLADV